MPPPPAQLPALTVGQYRRVRARGGGGCGVLGVGRLLILPHVFVGLALLVAMPGSVAWAIFGQDHAARVVRLSTSRGSKGGTTYRVAYAYTPPSGPRAAEAGVSSDAYHRLLAMPPPQRTVVVRALGTPPVFYDNVIDGPGDVWKKVGFICLFGTFWCAIVGVFAYALYVDPWRTCRLYRIGTPVRGEIVSKQTKGNKSPSSYLRYAYTTADGQRFEREMHTTAPLWYDARPQQPVTVLYHPAKPKRSIVYEYGPYECPAA